MNPRFDLTGFGLWSRRIKRIEHRSARYDGAAVGEQPAVAAPDTADGRFEQLGASWRGAGDAADGSQFHPQIGRAGGNAVAFIFMRKAAPKRAVKLCVRMIAPASGARSNAYGFPSAPVPSSPENPFYPSVCFKARRKKSRWPKFPDFRTTRRSGASSGVITGTPGATLPPIA